MTNGFRARHLGPSTGRNAKGPARKAGWNAWPRPGSLLLIALIAAAPAADPKAPIAALDEALMTSLNAASQTPFPKRWEMLAPPVDRAFNLPAILQATVGPQWSSIPPDQQAQLLKVFRTFTIASYAANFVNGPDTHIDLLPETRPIGDGQVVETKIVPPAGEPTRIDYVMKTGSNGWQATDVLLQGSISRVAVQRSDFRSLLASGGAGALIQSLQQKVTALSGGTIKP